MNPIPTALAFAQAIGFKVQSLSERWLQEKGVSPFGTFTLHRYALVLAVVWSILFVRPQEVMLLAHSPRLVIYILCIALLWNAQQFLSSRVLNTTSSVSALSTLQYLIYLPLLLVVGTYFNHDIPNVYSLAAIGFLAAAFIVQPSQHKANTRARLSLPLVIVGGFILLQASLDAMGNGLARAALQTMRPAVFLGVFSVITLSLCALWSSAPPPRPQDIQHLRQRRWLASTVPLFWFAASIPETYAYAKLPIYTVVSISAIAFAMDTLSDLFHHRIRFSVQTAGFIMLVLTGIGLAVRSV